MSVIFIRSYVLFATVHKQVSSLSIIVREHRIIVDRAHAYRMHQRKRP